MAPTSSSILVHSSSAPPGRHFRQLHRQASKISRHALTQSSTSRIKPRGLDGTLPPVVLESPPPTPLAPSGLATVLPPGVPTIPTGNSQPQGVNQANDIPGNIVAAVVVSVLILGGLIGLFIGGELLRRQTKTGGKRTSSPYSKCVGRRKSKPVKSTDGSPQQSLKPRHELDEKTSPPLACPPPALKRPEHPQRFPAVWPIRSLSRVLYSRSCPLAEQAGPSLRHELPAACPQTTWSEFSPVTLHVPPSRKVLDRIPEEHEEDCQSQSNSDIEVMLGVTFQRSLESTFVVSREQRTSPYNMLLDGSDEPEPSVTQGQLCPQDYRDARGEDSKSLGSTTPDMTSDGGESSRSSTASLESLGGNDKDSLGEDSVFELRRVQTRSMQINKGVLLSLSLKTFGDNQDPDPAHGEHGRGPTSGTPSTAGAEDGKGMVMLDGRYSVVSLDGFPSPSILPVIPSLVSGL